MNVVRSEKNLNASRGRGRGKARGKSSVNILPKYSIPNIQKYTNFPPPISSVTSSSRNSRHGVCGTTSSSCKKSSGTIKTSNSRTSRRTPHSSSTVEDSEVLVIVAITCGRGEARGEVGLAAIDIQCPHMILCQMSDCNSYINTLTKIHTFKPIEIIMPDTICDSDHNLYSAINERFPDVNITGIQRVHFTDVSGLDRIRTHCAEEYSSVQLIVRQKYYALAAAAALMKYVEFIQHVQYFPKSMRIEYQESQNNTIIDIESAQSLELVNTQGGQSNYSLLGALDRCSTPMGRRLLRASILQPPCNRDFIDTRQLCVTELVSNRSLCEIIQPVVRRLLGTSRLLGLAMHSPQLDTISRAEKNLNYILLLKNTLDIVPEFRVTLNTAQASFFQKVLADLQDERFDKIRTKISEVIHEGARAVVGYTSSNMQRCFALKQGISDMLDVARQTYCELIDDMKSLVSKLGDKYNLPLGLACNSVWGYHIEMDTSRRDINVENLPEEFVNAKKLKKSILMTTEQLLVLSIHCDEASEELHIMSDVLLKNVLDDIREYIGCLFQFNDNVAELDLIISLAQISSITDYVQPTFGPNLDVRHSKHPVMDIVGIESPTPNDVVASVAYNFHTITGPNMSGKTVYLKQIVLLQIMAQIGCYVPASSAHFRIADRIFCKVGTRDDIEHNASTFILEMKEAQYILQCITPCSLVVIDELARSTTVEEGASIAWAVFEELCNTTAFIFNATHFLQLLKMADLYPNIINHYLEAILTDDTNIDESRLMYTHQLKSGASSTEFYGLTLARSTGLPDDIVRKSRALAVKLSKSLKSSTGAINAQDAESNLQRKMNYDTLAEIYEKLRKDKKNTDEILKLTKNLKIIKDDEIFISAKIFRTPDNVSTKKPLIKSDTTNKSIPKSVKVTLSENSDTNGEFKKPNPVDSPRSIKELLSPIQARNLGKRVALTPIPCTSRTKISKFDNSLSKKNSLFGQYNSKTSHIFSGTSKQVKFFENPLTDPNSPIFVPPSEIPKSFKKSVNQIVTSAEQSTSSNPSTLKTTLKKQTKATDNSCTSDESPLFIPRSQAAQLKEKLSRNMVHSPIDYVPSQYRDMQNAIQTMTRINLSQENDSDDDNDENIEIPIVHDSNIMNPVIPINNCENFQLPLTSNQSTLNPSKLKINIPLDDIPEQYSYMRHILKTVTWNITKPDSNEVTNSSRKTSNKIDEYIVVSDPVSRSHNIQVSDRNIAASIKNVPAMTSASSVPSTPMISKNNLCPDGADFYLLNSHANLNDFSAMTPSNIEIFNTMNTDNPFSSVNSQSSIDTQAAQKSARKKEAEIFKIIEGSAFDEGNIMGSAKSHISLNSESSHN